MDLGLCVFTTTKGHYGREGLYKLTIENLKELGVLNKFNYKVVHIKQFGDDSDKLNAISEYFLRNGFFIITSKKEKTEKLEEYHNEYQKDITKMFSSGLVNRSEFSLWLEDDWIIKTKENLWDQFQYGCAILKNEKDLLSVRINHEFPTKDKYIAYNHKIFLQGDNYTQWGPTFTFQPTIVRTRDAYQAYRLINQNSKNIGHLHIELQSGIGFKALSEFKNPFAFFNPKDINAIHIGAPPFEELIK